MLMRDHLVYATFIFSGIGLTRTLRSRISIYILQGALSLSLSLSLSLWHLSILVGKLDR